MLLVLGLLVATVIVLKYFLDSIKFKNFPPGPPRLPVVGSLLSTPGELIHLHAERHWKHRYGPVVGLTTGSKGMIMVSGAEEVLAVLHHEHCQARPSNFTQRSFGKRLGLMFTDGPYWTAHRRFTLRELRDLGMGRNKLEGVVLDELDRTADVIGREGPVIEPNRLFNAPVLNVLWWMVSGKPFSHGAGSAVDPESRRLLDIMNRAMRNKRLGVAPCDIWPFLGRVAPQWSGYNDTYLPITAMNDYLREEIKLQRQSGNTNSFMGKYTEEIDEPKNGFSDDGLVVLCLDLFMAGGESTANTLSFGLLYMAMYPELQAKVHAELDAVCGGPDRVVSMDYKTKLPYVEATLTEVMRINTIAPLAIPHTNSETIQLNGYSIPKGTLILLSLWNVLNDKKHWGDPDNFRPERFLGEDGKFVKDPWMIPFGIGKRACIGEGFAMQVAFLFFANLLNRFTFSLLPGAEKPSTIPESGFTVTPRHFEVLAKPRAK